MTQFSRDAGATGHPRPSGSLCPKGEPAAWCSKCLVRKPLGEFATDRSKANGRKSLCKACDREKARRYYAEHRAVGRPGAGDGSG